MLVGFGKLVEFQLLITQTGAGQTPTTAGSAKVDGANMTTAFAGSIQITRLTANTLTGLSIVTFENPSGNSDETLGHGLGKTPEMIWTKSRDTGGNANPWADLS